MNLTVVKTLLVTGALAIAGGTTAFVASDAEVTVPETIALQVDGGNFQFTAAEGQVPENGLGLSEEARTFLMDSVKAVTAETLGVSVEELEAADREGRAELLEAAGLTPEDIQAAVEAAWPSIVAEAEDNGLITAEQATILLENGPRIGGPRGRRGGPGGGRGGNGFGAGFLPPETRQEIVATSLGITVEALEAYHADGLDIREIAEELGLEMSDVREAVQEATIAAVEEAAANGTITEEQAETILNHIALQQVSHDINEQATLQALGITAEELQAYKDEGLRMNEIIAELGLDAETVRTDVENGREALVQQALDDGTITAAQVEQLMFGRGGRGHGGHGGPHGGPQGRRGPGQGAPNGTNNNAPNPLDSNA